MRIFVMFGTQDKRFDRLLNAILNSHFVEENDVYVQLGYTKGNYEKIYGQEYYTEDHEMMKEIKKTNQSRSWYMPAGTKEHLFKFLCNFPITIIRSFKAFLKVKPDVVIATGAHTTVPICYIAKLFGKKVIFIETFANITTKTLSGKLVYPIADLFLVQWEEMLKLYPNAKYRGGLK